MNTKFIENEIKYTGNELAPHWIYKKFHLQGDSIVGFIGECEVNLSEMVDIEDVINDEPIYSKSMLSFIIEHFNINLPEGVCRQRLFTTTIKEVLEDMGFLIKRNGDDLFFEDKKLSVSIATKSATSVLIHTGLNITSEGTPIKTSGLTSDMEIKNVKEFANKIMERYNFEINDIMMATVKVRGV
jgi:uncharacterized protein